MITSITFILDPPLGRYSSGTCVRLVGEGAAPGRTEHGSPRGPGTGDLEKVPAREGAAVNLASWTRRKRGPRSSPGPHVRHISLDKA